MVEGLGKVLEAGGGVNAADVDVRGKCVEAIEGDINGRTCVAAVDIRGKFDKDDDRANGVDVVG